MTALATMLAIVAALFVPLKVAGTWMSGVRLSAGRWVAFALLWPGMDPAPFATRRPAPAPGHLALALRGAAHVALGLALCALAAVVLDLTGSFALGSLVLLIGLTNVVHFGACRLVESAWRRAGFDVPALFDAPLASRSLDEFWSRRWNTAFSRMTALLVYRPVARRAGRAWALVAAFLFSGLVHELAISVPAGAGYGAPTLYFALHGALTLLERRSARGGRAWTAFWLLAPLPLLFHAPFIARCLWPLTGR